MPERGDAAGGPPQALPTRSVNRGIHTAMRGVCLKLEASSPGLIDLLVANINQPLERWYSHRSARRPLREIS